MVGSLVVGRFRIVRELGAGAFGQTFLAQDLQKMDAQCVVKRLITPNDPAHIDIVRQMFEREAKKLNDLDHHGIPKLIAYFEDGGEFYLVQDFVDGDTLDKEINPSRKWTEGEVTSFLLEVLDILAYVHKEGSIHRDLKPNNMMRRKANKKLVLIDFGAVREVRQTTTNLAIGLASGTVTIGTPGYMPAEQTQGRPSFASDVYAIGCISIEALIGRSPHPSGFDTDVNTGEFLWRHRTQVSDEFAAIIDKMVCYDWRQRYRNAGEALAALQALSHNIPKAPSLQTQTLNNIITVDRSGKQINRRSVQVQYFTEDKISLPNGAKAMEMAKIPAGSFKIGSPRGVEGRGDDETPQTEINFAQPFYISRYAVTQAQWFAVMGIDYDNGFKKRFGKLENKFKGDNRPIVVVNWHDAKAYCSSFKFKKQQSIQT
jgi:serine/threonine protein kinase